MLLKVKHAAQLIPCHKRVNIGVSFRRTSSLASPNTYFFRVWRAGKSVLVKIIINERVSLTLYTLYIIGGEHRREEKIKNITKLCKNKKREKKWDAKRDMSRVSRSFKKKLNWARIGSGSECNFRQFEFIVCVFECPWKSEIWQHSLAFQCRSLISWENRIFPSKTLSSSNRVKKKKKLWTRSDLGSGNDFFEIAQ